MRLMLVNFHYVRNLIYNAGIYPRTSLQISRQIREIKRNYDFISHQDLMEIKLGRSDYCGNKCLLTFDDGLKEQLEAFELLDHFDIPFVAFISTKTLRKDFVADVHKVHLCRAEMGDAEFFSQVSQHIGERSVSYPENLNDLYRYDSLEVKKLKYLLNFGLPDSDRQSLISKVFDDNFSSRLVSETLYLSEEDVARLARLGRVGSHGETHQPLAKMDVIECYKEMISSKDKLVSLGADENIGISYPYGGELAVSEDVCEMALAAGYSYGITMRRGTVEVGKSDLNWMKLPRLDTNDAPGGKHVTSVGIP